MCERVTVFGVEETTWESRLEKLRAVWSHLQIYFSFWRGTKIPPSLVLPALTFESSFAVPSAFVSRFPAE